MEDNGKSTVCSSETDQILLHVGTSCDRQDSRYEWRLQARMLICSDIIDLASFIKDNGIKVAIQSLQWCSHERAKIVSARA